MNKIDAKNCLLCQSKEYEVATNKLRYGIKRRVLKCRNCGLIYQESSNLDKKFYKGKDYRKTYGPNLKKSSNAQEIFNTYLPFQQEIINEIADILKPNMKVLEVGCSTGHFLTALKGMVKERVGLELSQDAVDFIRKKLDFKVYSEPIEEIKIKEAPFDLIISMQVIEHTQNPLSFVTNISKYLKPNGYLYLELPNIDNALFATYQIPAYKEFYYVEPHLWYFSRETLKLLLAKVGFKGEIKTVQRYNFLNHLHWLFLKKPQDNFVIGNTTPILINGGNVNKVVKKDLNDFIKRVDTEYKQILIKHNIGESLAFLGKKI